MKKLDEHTLLTDELERQLMAQAIEEHLRFKPIKELKAFFARLVAPKLNRTEHAVSSDTAQAQAAN